MSNPCIEHVAALVRLTAPDDARPELVDRAAVVDIAMRIKAASDRMAADLAAREARIEQLHVVIDAETVPRWQADALVAAEREECAKTVEAARSNWNRNDIAASIRARGAK